MTQNSGDTRLIGLLVRFAVDVASARASEQVLESQADKVKFLAKQVQDLNLTSEQAMALSRSIGLLDKNGKALGDTFTSESIALAKFRTELKALSTEADKLSKTTATSGQGLSLNNSEFMRAQVEVAHEAAILEDQQRAAAAASAASQEQITAELERQLPLAERLNAAATVRQSAETGFLSNLRTDAFGAGAQRNQVGNNIYRFGRELFMLPNLNITPGFSSTDVSRFAMLGGGVADRANTSLRGLFGTLAIGVPAIAPLVALYAAATAEQEKNAQAVRDTIARLKEEREARSQLRGVVGEGDFGGIGTQIAQLKAQINDIQSVVIDPLLAEIGNQEAVTRANYGNQPVIDLSGNSARQDQVRDSQLEIAGLNLQIANLQDTGAKGAEAVQRINRSLEGTQRARDIAAMSLDDANQELSNLREDNATRAAQIVSYEGLIADARASGREVLVDALLIEQQKVVADQAEADWLIQLYERMLPVIQLREQETEAAQRQADAMQRIDDAERSRAQDVLAGINMTQEQRTAEINSLNAQIAALDKYIASNNLSTGTVQELNAQITTMQNRIVELEGITDSYGDALERERLAKENLEQTGKNLERTYEDYGKARDELIRMQDELTQAEKEHAATVEQIDADRRKKVGKAIQDQVDDEADVRAKSAKDLGESLEKIETESNKRIEQIRLNSTRTILRAIARGDQASAIEALEDQQFAIREEKKKRGEAEDEKRKQIDDKLTEQLATIEKRYDEQIKAANDAARDATVAETTRWKNEKAIRDRAILDQQTSVRNAEVAIAALEAYYRTLTVQSMLSHNSQLQSLVDSGLAGIRTAWSNFFAFLSGDAQQAFGQTPNVNYGNGNVAYYPQETQQERERREAIERAYQEYYRNAGVTNSIAARAVGGGGFDVGGFNTKPGVYWSGVPEYHIPVADVNRFSQSMGSTVYDVKIDAYGMDEQQLQRAVTKGIEQAKPRIKQEVSDELARIDRNKRTRVNR